jgi:RimJ/RimL family protein N-acetyltransferase
MIVKEYGNAELFLKEHEITLLENEAASQLLLYFARQSMHAPGAEKELYGVVIEETKITLLFGIIHNVDLFIYSVDTEREDAAAIALADYLGNSHVVLGGLNARNPLCHSFIDQFKKYQKGTFIQKLGTDIMELRQVNDIKPVDGKQRLAIADDKKLIADWMIQFQIEALIAEADYEASLQRAAQLIEQKEMYLYEDEEHQAVSMAAASRRLVHGIGITYVFTPQEHRGKGYAAANIYYLSKTLLEQGYEFCTLFIDKNNPLSNRAYEKVGYKVIGESFEYNIIPLEV